MNKINDELQDSQNFQPDEKFCFFTKFALIVGNQDYNEEHITLGSIPAVADNIKVAKNTVSMMNIPVENTIVVQDAKADQLNKFFAWF